jgi:LmbE family N-acetylglucosaminyl deacetylase
LKRHSAIFIGIVFLRLAVAAAVELPPLPAITADDRIVIVAPHPDDEALATGGLIQHAVAKRAQVQVIYLTNGDHNQIAYKLYEGRLFLNASHYRSLGAKRRQEAINATTVLGLTTNQLTFLGYPDWGTLRIWRDYWPTNKVFRSDATRANAVPYPEAPGYRQPYTPESIQQDFVTLLRRLRPTKLFITHPADTNPDHRSVANFARLALLDLASEGIRPQVYCYLVHFGGWTKPLGYKPHLFIAPPRRLLDDGHWMSLPLTGNQIQNKLVAILENRTQLTIGQRFLLSLARSNEIYATLPVPAIPVIPASVPLDWRAAVRNKAIQYTPFDPTGRLNGNDEPISHSLEETDFLRQCDDLIAIIEYKNRLGPRTNVHLFLYPYRQGTPFSEMPKVQVNINPLGSVKLYAGGKYIRDKTITKRNIGSRSFLRIPLRLLTDENNMPDHIFTCTRTNLGGISPDDSAWQLFRLEP